MITVIYIINGLEWFPCRAVALKKYWIIVIIFSDNATWTRNQTDESSKRGVKLNTAPSFRDLSCKSWGYSLPLQWIDWKGFVKVKNFKNSWNKRDYAYTPIPFGINHKRKIAIELLKGKKQEFDTLKREIALIEDRLRQRERQWWGWTVTKYGRP